MDGRAGKVIPEFLVLLAVLALWLLLQIVLLPRLGFRT